MEDRLYYCPPYYVRVGVGGSSELPKPTYEIVNEDTTHVEDTQPILANAMKQARFFAVALLEEQDRAERGETGAWIVDAEEPDDGGHG